MNTGLVDTGLTGVLMAACPPEMVTPHSTIVKAFETFLNDDSVTAMAAECSGDSVYLQDHQKWSDDKARFLMDHGLDPYLAKQGYDVKKGLKKESLGPEDTFVTQ